MAWVLSGLSDGLARLNAEAVVELGDRLFCPVNAGSISHNSAEFKALQPAGDWNAATRAYRGRKNHALVGPTSTSECSRGATSWPKRAGATTNTPADARAHQTRAISQTKLGTL